MFSYYYVLTDAGEPERTDDVLVWSEWFERATRDRTRIVAQDLDEQPGAPDVLVSTVFLGLDHAFDGGTPVLWETMILGGPEDGYQRRYTSRQAAIDGHAAACRIARRGKP